MAALSSHILAPQSRRSVLVPNVAVWSIVACVVLAFSSTLHALTKVWIDSVDYQHGFLIAVVCLWLIVDARSRIAATPTRAQPFLLPLLAIALFGWMVAFRANSEILQQIAFPIVLFLSVQAALGGAVVRQLAFPIGYLFFAIPIWDQLVPLLQWMATRVSEGTLALLGVSATIEGFNVTIPEGTFSIVEGCSGKRYLIVSLALAALAGALQGVRGRRFVLLLSLAAFAALVTNWVRIIVIIYAGHLSDMRHHLVAVEHHSLGYALYVPLLVGIVWAARRLRTSTAQPSSPRPASDTSFKSLSAGVAGPVALVICATLALQTSAAVDDGAIALSSAPLLTEAWQGPLPPQSEWHPQFSAAKDEFRASYSHEADRVEAYVNVYGVQSPGAELIQFGNSIAPSSTWTLVRSIDAGMPFRAAVVSSASGHRWLVAHTYVVGGRVVASSAMAQLIYGWLALWRPVPSGVIAFAAPCKADCTSVLEQTRALWSQHGTTFVAMIPEKI